MGQDWFCWLAKIPRGYMMFCPKCGSLLKSKKIGAKAVKYCECGFKEKGAEPEIMSSGKKADPDEVRFDVVEVDDSEKIHPIDSEEVCPKCENKGAYFWMAQTRGADEPETKFLKCTKCRHIWRDYN